MSGPVSHRARTGVKAVRGTLPRVRRLMWTLARIALVLAVMAVLRQVLLDRGPRQALHGDDPVIGSLDTWPAVPRKPAG
jgi:hypothetical protein